MTEPALETLTPTTNSTWRLDVDIAGSPTQVRAMSSFTPTLNNNIEDATDYDTDGWGSDAVTQRKWQNTGSVLRKYGAAGYDPGQEALRSAADSGELVTVRWYERTGQTGAEAYEGEAIVQWEPQGGPATGLKTVNFTLLGQGARRTIAVPTAAPAA